MKKFIHVKFEYIDFKKSGIKHLCINKEKDLWYEGFFYGFEEKKNGIWEAKIRINYNLSLLKQMRAFIHECIHLMLDFIWVFAFNLDMGRCDYTRHHQICYTIDKIVYKVLKTFFKKEAKWHGKKKGNNIR